MSYMKAMTSKRYNAAGKAYEVDEVLVEFNNEGTIEQVEIYNEVLQDWFVINFNKLNSVDTAKIQEFVYESLREIHEKLANKHYENDNRSFHE